MTTVQATNSTSSNYQQRLVASPDLDEERRKAEALLAEAKAEAERNAKKAAELKAIAERRLAMIAREQEMRAKEASGGLPPALTKQREADAAAYRARVVESTRLDTVKHDYAKTLQGKTPKDLRAEQKSEHERLGDAQHALTVAREQLKSAKTPAQRQAAAQVVSSAERALRTEYAKAAAIDNVAPVNLDHQKLHDYANTLKTKSVKQLSAERAAVDADMHGAIHGTRAQRELDKVKLAIIDQAIAKKVGGVGPIDDARKPGNVVFDGAGAFIRDAATMDPATLAAKCKAAGVSWVSLEIGDQGGLKEGNLTALENGWADKLREQGIKVGFWSVSSGGGNAANDARTAAQITARYKGDFYVADCEDAFQQRPVPPNATDEEKAEIAKDNALRAGENSAFTEAFRTEAENLGIGDVPRALSPMGREAIDHKPWIEGGWDVLPQAYWNSHAVYQPSQCVDFYADCGWPKDRIHPTIATYDASSESAEATPRSIADYQKDLATTGTHGFSYYLPEDYLNDAGWDELGRAIRES